jgi:hypothetical protein
VNKLFPRPPVFVKRLTHEMTSRKVPGSEAQTTESVVVTDARLGEASPTRNEEGQCTISGAQGTARRPLPGSGRGL